MAILIGGDLTAFVYWVLFFTGDRSFAAPTAFQRGAEVIAIPGSLAAIVIPPTGIHSGVFDEVSFVGNALFYSAIAYAVLGRWRKPV